jgi:hypothetical protein
MSAWVWVIVVVAVALVALAVFRSALKTRRSHELQERFGPEYDKVAADAPSKREAEAELLARERRLEEFDIEPLDRDERDRFRVRWTEVQAEFVDDPAAAVLRADALIQQVMRARGYPMDDFETRAADLSVDHPDVVERYRAGHAIAVAQERGNAGTEELRHAMKHYRELFDSLVEAHDVHEVPS